jgi:hypothetical protein
LGIGIAAAAVLIGGTAVAVTSLAGGSPSTASSVGASSANTGASTKATGMNAQAKALNSVLNSAGSSSSTADVSSVSGNRSDHLGHPGPCARVARALRAEGHPTAAQEALGVCRRRLARLRMLLAGEHGEVTFKSKSGPRTLAFERGVVQSVSASTVTVRAADGTTWTWHIVSDTVVRQHGSKVSTHDLADGTNVFVGGPVITGTMDARLIAIRPATAAQPSASPSS